jgi:hypothetical protein
MLKNKLAFLSAGIALATAIGAAAPAYAWQSQGDGQSHGQVTVQKGDTINFLPILVCGNNIANDVTTGLVPVPVTVLLDSLLQLPATGSCSNSGAVQTSN